MTIIVTWVTTEVFYAISVALGYKADKKQFLDELFRIRS